MREIPLTQGKTAFVDDVDYDLVGSKRWCAVRSKKHWYAQRKEHKRTVYMHREIAARAGLPIVDHRDGNGLNNQRSNLRPATYQNNMANSRKQPCKLSEYKGVTLHKDTGKWMAQLKVNGTNSYLGLFSDEIDAAKAYDVAAVEQFGKFAILNLA